MTVALVDGSKGVDFIEEPEAVLEPLWILKKGIYFFTDSKLYLLLEKISALQIRGRVVHIAAGGHTHKVALRDEKEALAFVTQWKIAVQKLI